MTLKKQKPQLPSLRSAFLIQGITWSLVVGKITTTVASSNFNAKLAS